MKKAKIGFSLMAALVLLLFSCDNPLLTKPYFGDGLISGGRNAAPDGLRASHGEKGFITLSWSENSNASLYYIYKADSPLETFERRGETTNTEYKFPVTAGTTAYYRISFLSYDGTESPKSMYIMGTSLAQPFISDITDVTEEKATVTWYMDNAFENTYKNNLLYTVYCFIKGGAEVAQIALDGSTLTENKATFTNLTAKTSYEFQVEAYLSSDQNASEKSDKVDGATARRMRPGAPIELQASCGTSASEIVLMFKLPDMVDIALGDNQFDPKPVYFVIARRQYREGGNNAYSTAVSYFGSIKDPWEYGAYAPGATVTWTDKTPSRGIVYEYRVWSYVDDTQKVISSDTSWASATGWALSKGTLLAENASYKLNEHGDLYASATVPLVFELDHKNVAYEYRLLETIEPLKDSYGLDPDITIEREVNTFTRYNDIRNYTAQMNLTQKSSSASPGRGLYSYAVEIKLHGAIIDTVSTIGVKEVSEDINPIVVDYFIVQDGYKDKFRFKWPRYDNRGYEIYMSDTGKEPWTKIYTATIADDTSDDFNDNTYEHSSGISTGMIKYFAIQPFRNTSGGIKQGQRVYALSEGNDGFKTLGVPSLTLGADPSYSEITAIWTEAQKADNYRIKYWYTGESASATTLPLIKKEDIGLDAFDNRIYTFRPFTTIDVSKAGKEIFVEVDALNEGLRATDGGVEISTSSLEKPHARLVGPAELNPTASRAVSPQDINVSWNKVSEAGGYYVFRRQFNMNNSEEEKTEISEEGGTIAYYVREVEGLITVTGKSLAVDSDKAKVDTNVVKAEASLNGNVFTLKDKYLPETEGGYNNHTVAYRTQQIEMAQGLSYRYYVVPVVKGDDFPLITFHYNKGGTNKNTSINYYTIDDDGVNIRYNGAAALEKEGFVIGFGQDVEATKGTYATSGNVNDRIQITWSLPAKLDGIISPSYTLFRRQANTNTWQTVTGTTAKQYLDTPPERGVTYEYVVGIANGSGAAGSRPDLSGTFIKRCFDLRDAKQRSRFLGYMLDYVTIQNVSRDARSKDGQFAEEIRWTSAGIKNTDPSNASNYNWGIDGYAIFLLNRNVNNGRQWITGDDLSTGSLPNQTSLSFLFANNADNRLKVLRDYRHYYKIRTYVLNDQNQKIYGPDPAPEYAGASGVSYDMNTDYVKWGARQISADEFAAITSLHMATGMNWWGNKSGDAMDRNWNGSGINVNISESNVGYNRKITFNNARPYFITISGDLHGHCGATAQTPFVYGADCGSGLGGKLSGSNAHETTLTFTGPGDVTGLYSGSVKIRLLKNEGGTGPYKVTYNGQTDLAIDNKHCRGNFHFDGTSNNYNTTREKDWSSGGGVANTNPGKWWYPVNGNRAGWD